ncbi:sugar phosphate isomerase/epimerase [Candidatus Gracilibacteria bacterium]|nr:sugar phosphate isomerase/epimerase [Candidatus Gracilibacteria bacterium]NUJ98603.1 sugar phosphate isomerase/epimerase [Candidatus Gracilibacteria bacterium]
MLLLSSSSLKGYGIHRIFKIVKETNFDGIDLCIEHEDYDSWDKEYLLSLIKEFKTPILSITAPSEKMSKEKFNTIKEIAIFCGAKTITISPPRISDKNTTWFTDYINKIEKIPGIDICIQNVAPKFLFFIIPEYKNTTLEQIKKITGTTSLDISGIELSSGMDIIKAARILGNTMRNIFICDKNGNKDGLLPGEAGGGVSFLPLESFFMQLKTSGYKSFLSLKVEPQEISIGDDEEIKEKLGKFKEYYEKYFVNFK